MALPSPSRNSPNYGPSVEESLRLLEESLALFRELDCRWEVANVLSELAWDYSSQGDQETARARYVGALAIFRDVGDQRMVAWMLHGLGKVAVERQEWETATSCFMESLAAFRDLDNEHGAANALISLGEVARIQGRLAAAHSFLEESRRLLSALAEPELLAWSLTHLGGVLVDQGELRIGQAHYRDALAVFRRRENDNPMAIAVCARGLGRVAGLSGRPELAVQLFAAADALCRAAGVSPDPYAQPSREQQLAELRHAMGEAAFTAAWKAGEVLTWEQAASLALEREKPPGSSGFLP